LPREDQRIGWRCAPTFLAGINPRPPTAPRESSCFPLDDRAIAGTSAPSGRQKTCRERISALDCGACNAQSAKWEVRSGRCEVGGAKWEVRGGRRVTRRYAHPCCEKFGSSIDCTPFALLFWVASMSLVVAQQFAASGAAQRIRRAAFHVLASAAVHGARRHRLRRRRQRLRQTKSRCGAGVARMCRPLRP
jgi:hypothetical protein